MAGKRSKCLACSRKAERRGLCKACYQRAYRANKKGEMSFEQQEAQGLIGPSERGPSVSPWAKKAGLVGKR